MNHQNVNLAPGLYLVATPIGTARDITLRALDVLASADVLAAEDTRTLRRLMDIHGVPLNGRKVVAYHDHSSDESRARLVALVAGGASVAYASEAGMPLIADPGYGLAAAVTEAGLTVTVVPGASAVLTALSLSGLPSNAFFFAGFLPNSGGARRSRLEALADVPGTLIFYEAPHRVAASLTDMADTLGADRTAALCRELTKKFEEIRRGTLAELAETARSSPPRGEIVLVVDRVRSGAVKEDDVEQVLGDALKTMSVRDAADAVAAAHGMPRRKVYQMALRLSANKDDGE
ncbi:16S rRNA (cytidine(1402)-2'-O)-methyltransferase [Chachezhania antarctica]|uniref:16S rRNA (cytidine(1402)-2'-O)-methyltransferase n=1 Tax=Chachezhania antarctica TaxID=2340860 RepID=UPI000EABD876|nr:16S rRNA (cytidine(1402)-2'-O)-methyltransferase [Chachezhania antarctica]